MNTLTASTRLSVLSNTDVWVYITHFVSEQRKWYRELAELYEHLGEWRSGVGKPRFAHPINNILWCAISLPVRQVHVRVVSNQKLGSIEEFFRHLVATRSDGSTIQNIVDGPLDKEDPFTLTWQHKKYLTSDLSIAREDSIFVYLEHDQLLTSTNLEYFAQASETLGTINLAPDFLRCEWHSEKQKWTLTDVVDLSAIKVELEPEGNLRYARFANDYCGFYVMSRATALRHQNLPTSSLETIRTDLPEALHRKLRHLRSAELAALGSRFDNWLSSVHREETPESNHVIPLSSDLRTIDWRCLSWHISNNYAKTRRFRRSGYGQIPVTDISF